MVVPLKDGHVGVSRVSLALDPFDVELLDRLAALQGSNRSEQLRQLLEQLRPMLQATVEAFEGATRARDALDRAAAGATVESIAALVPRAEKMQAEFLGSLAALEGAEAARDPRPCNHGGHTPTPTASTPPL